MNWKEIILQSFPETNVEWVETESGGKKPKVKVGNTTCFSPSKLLAYKTSQIYSTAMSWSKNFEIAINKGLEYHKLFELLNKDKLPPVIMKDTSKAFIDGVKQVYKDHKLTPLVSEMVLFNKETKTMCIVDGIAQDDNGNLVILELKTQASFGNDKKLLSFFQTHFAKEIITRTIPEATEIKTLTLHWDEKFSTLKVYDSADYDLSKLDNVLKAILDVETEWNFLLEEIKDKNKNKTKNILERLKNNE